MSPIIKFKDEAGNNYPEWTIQKVKDLFEITRGCVLAADNVKISKGQTHPYPVYSSQTKNNGLMGYYDKYLYENAITWTTDGANAGTVNFREGKFYCTNVCGVLLNKDGYANKCIAEIIGCISKRYVSYVGNPKLMNNVMSEISILIPCLKEQEKIASFLTSIDNLISTQESNISILETYNRGLISKILNQEIRFKDTDGNDYSGWSEKTFDELADYKKGPFGSALKKEIFVPKSNTTKKVYEQQHAIEKDCSIERYFITNEYYEKMKSFSVKKGDIIVSCAGTIGEIYVLPSNTEDGIINQALMRVRINNKIINQKFFITIFDNMISTKGKKLSNGSALKNIPPFADLKKQITLVPCLEEQEKISNFLTSLDNVLQEEKNYLEYLKTLKKGLLQQMFV